MRLQNRVEKLEQATGINEPCEVCEAVDRSAARSAELMKELGIVYPKRRPVLVYAYCAWCLRTVIIDLCFFNVSKRVLYERMVQAYAGGTLCLPENATLWDELNAAFDRASRELYGQHYDRYLEMHNIFLDELADIQKRRAPAKMHLCSVPGCACKYPKTEAEWQRNVKARGLAA